MISAEPKFDQRIFDGDVGSSKNSDDSFRRIYSKDKIIFLFIYESLEEVGTKDPGFVRVRRKKSIDGREESLNYSIKYRDTRRGVIYRPVCRNQYTAISTGRVSKRTPNFNQTTRARDDFSPDNDYVNASINDTSPLVT